ncbi:MAG: diguanylate cyclase [Sphingopyxis sp.]|nr:diguanylate cyclase [Sphingopyxis sp.]
MTHSLSPKVEAVFWFLVTAAGYFLLASLSLYTTKGADNIAAIWPPSGYFLGILLLMPAQARLLGFLAMVSASIGANMVQGIESLTTAIFTAANVTEAAVAFWLLRRREPGELSFMVPRAVGSFCIAALCASFVSAAMATLLSGKGVDFFLSWMTTVALGMLIVTPPIVMLARMVRSNAFRNVPHFMQVEAAAILAGAGLITLVCFSQSEFPVTFLPSVSVFVAAYRLGPFGAAAGTLIVAIITSFMTGHGYGPIAAMQESQKVQVFFLQFYLVTILFIALPLAALLVVQRRLAKRLEQSNRWLLQAEAAALVGHWRVDIARWAIQWSDQTYRVHGLEPGMPVDVDYSVRQYVAEDRRAVRKVLADAIRMGRPFEFQGRILRTDGEIRHIKSHGSIERNLAGDAVGIFGTVQDVTETVENARILEAARSAAERVANTDMLTGLPNRRHALAFLEKALNGARENGAPLAVAIFDIDHFKRINDTYGHAVGDQVIRRVAHRAKAALRDEDMLGRIGGEEFVCVLQRSSAQSAEIVAERVRKAVETGTAAEDGIPDATISVGLAVFDGEIDSEELLNRADQALYVAKREGRNRMRSAA